MDNVMQGERGMTLTITKDREPVPPPYIPPEDRKRLTPEYVHNRKQRRARLAKSRKTKKQLTKFKVKGVV